MHRLIRRARNNGGYVTRREALDAGYGERELADVLAREWATVRRGVYAPKQWYEGLGERERHLLLVRSVLDELGSDWVATHDSAVVAHGLGDYGQGTYGLDLAVAHVARIGGTTSRRTASVQYHRGAVAPEQVTSAAGLPALGATPAVVEAMTQHPLDAATVLACSWLACRRTEARQAGRLAAFDEEAARAELRATLDAVGARRGTRTARDAIEIADPRCESVGEARFLVLCWEHDLPRPETQVQVDLPNGTWAEVDFLFREVGMIVEFDGMLKYEDEPGRTAKEKVAAEKRRERALRDLGWHLVRVTWADLAPANRTRTVAYLRRELAAAAARR